MHFHGWSSLFCLIVYPAEGSSADRDVEAGKCTDDDDDGADDDDDDDKDCEGNSNNSNGNCDSLDLRNTSRANAEVACKTEICCAFLFPIITHNVL